jgi:hypothetical protein
MECVVGADGIARVPGLRSTPDFNLEESAAAATEFTMEPAGGEGRNASPRRASREEIERLAGPAAAAPAHDDE